MQGSGFLMVEENAFLILDFGYGDNFLLRNSSIYGQMIQTSPGFFLKIFFIVFDEEILLLLFLLFLLLILYYN